MENHIIPSTSRTPEINFNAQNGKLNIEGRAIMEEAKKFFMPVMDWVEEYCKSTIATTELTVKSEYINDGAFKRYADIIRILTDFCKEHKELVVNIYYEEDDGHGECLIDFCERIFCLKVNKILCDDW